jgi:hypothetical protein
MDIQEKKIAGAPSVSNIQFNERPAAIASELSPKAVNFLKVDISSPEQ